MDIRYLIQDIYMIPVSLSLSIKATWIPFGYLNGQ